MSNSIRPIGELNPKPVNVLKVTLNVVTDPEECCKLEEEQLARARKNLQSPDWLRRFVTVQWLSFSYSCSVIKPRFSEIAVPLLIETLNDSDPNIRREAVVSLGKIGDQRAIEPITKLLHDPEVSNCARTVLKNLNPSFLNKVVSCLSYPFSHRTREQD